MEDKISNMKQKIIIFEGIDKSGKTTLKEELNRQSNYQYWVLDRSPISSIVYDEIFNRNNREYWFRLIQALYDTFDVKLIYCKTTPDIIKDRLEKANEKVQGKLNDFTFVDKCFRNTIKLVTNKCCIVDTSNSIEESICQIMKFIED